jgi:hypothetical protein
MRFGTSQVLRLVLGDMSLGDDGCEDGSTSKG